MRASFKTSLIEQFTALKLQVGEKFPNENRVIGQSTPVRNPKKTSRADLTIFKKNLHMQYAHLCSQKYRLKPPLLCLKNNIA
jgi:hypothetical protein